MVMNALVAVGGSGRYRSACLPGQAKTSLNPRGLGLDPGWTVRVDKCIVTFTFVFVFIFVFISIPIFIFTLIILAFTSIFINFALNFALISALHRHGRHLQPDKFHLFIPQSSVLVAIEALRTTGSSLRQVYRHPALRTTADDFRHFATGLRQKWRWG